MLISKLVSRITCRRNLYRRTSDVFKEKTLYNRNLLRDTVERSNIKVPNDWKDVRNEVLASSGPRDQITPMTIDAMTIGVCMSLEKFDLAFSYLDFMHSEKMKPNLATMGKVFKLLYLVSAEQKATPEIEERILELYKNLRESYPVLDILTLENVISAISITKKWKLCLNLLDEYKLVAIPNTSSYSVTIAAAFSNNEDDLAWKLLGEMLDNGRLPNQNVFISYFKKPGRKIGEFEKMFEFLHQSQIKIDTKVIEILQEVYKHHNKFARLTTTNHRGMCKCCNNKLLKFNLSESEFADLKSTIIENVIVGRDIFNKSTPQELQQFKEFISKMPQFDVVLDGLNIAYSAGARQSPHVTSGLVTAVVSHFVKQGKKVLVLGRVHMERWPAGNWNYITDHATVFLTQNLSQDDPYLIYCALNSGQDTIIVTKDLMRGHKFLLKNLQKELLFQRWLSQSQYHLLRVKDDGSVIFKLPFPFSQIAQKNNEFWHIPYQSQFQNKNLATVKTSNNWICLQS